MKIRAGVLLCALALAGSVDAQLRRPGMLNRRGPMLGNRGAYLYQRMSDKLVEHKQFIHQYGVDLPEVAGWKWEK